MTTPPDEKLGLAEDRGSPRNRDDPSGPASKKARYEYLKEGDKDLSLSSSQEQVTASNGTVSNSNHAALEDDSKAGAAGRDDAGEDKMDDRLTFPERLMYLLQNETEPEALWWQKDGLSFGFEPKVFTERVLNKLFPSKIKFESFIRKLNRWGFRRVPGQGLPPNGAAYKHPLFKKADPELMKSMKFGQKGEPAPRPSPFLNLDPTAAALRGTQLPSGLEQALAGPPSLASASNHAQTLQSLQQQAFLQSMASNQQRQAAVAAEYLAQQQFAADALSTSKNDSETDLRNRLLLGSMPGSFPSFQLPPSMSNVIQRHTSQASQQGSQLPGTNSTFGSAISDMEWRNRLLLGTAMPAPADSSSNQADRFAAAMAASRPGGSSLGGANPSSSQLDLNSRLLLSGISGNQQQSHNPQSQQGGQGILDQLALLRQHQAMRSRDPTADLLQLLEQQERQRNQGNQGNQDR